MTELHEEDLANRRYPVAVPGTGARVELAAQARASVAAAGVIGRLMTLEDAGEPVVFRSGA